MQPARTESGYGMTVSACLWLGLFPLLQGGTYSRLTHDKWVIMLILTGVTVLCFLFDLLRGSRSSSGLSLRLHALPLILASALMVWIILSCLLSSSGPDIWWRGESARYEGLASQLCYYAIFVCFLFSRIRLEPALLSAAAGVLVFSVIILLQRAGGNPLGLYPAGRSYQLNPIFQGTIGNVDMDTGYLLLLAGLLFYRLLDPVLRGKNRALSAAAAQPSRRAVAQGLPAAAFFVLALALSLWLIFTMDFQFGIISLGILCLLTALRLLPKKARLPLLVLLFVLVLIIIWFWPGQSGALYELHEILRGRARLSFGHNRVAVWNYTLRMSGEHLLFGGGSGTFETRFNQYLSDHDLVIPREQDGQLLPDYFDNPHNEYIAHLADHGLPAMLLFLALVLTAVFRRREGLLPCLAPCSAAVLSYAVQAFFSFSVCIVAPMFWVLLGLSFSDRE